MIFLGSGVGDVLDSRKHHCSGYAFRDLRAYCCAIGEAKEANPTNAYVRFEMHVDIPERRYTDEM